MLYEEVATIEDGLKKMLEDEEKGIAEYERLAHEAARLGAINTAIAYRDIWKQEKQHAQKLRELIAAAELSKFGMQPGQDVGAVMEPHRGGYVGEGYVGNRRHNPIRVPNAPAGQGEGHAAGYRGHASAVREPHRARY